MRLINEEHKVDPGNQAMVLDQWLTPPQVVKALTTMECGALPRYLFEPCCGDSTGFVRPTEEAGYEVWARDVDPDFGYTQSNFLTDPLPEDWLAHADSGIISNPPFTLAEEFVRKAIEVAPYSAWLLRLNWLEGVKRKRLFKEQCRARVLYLGSRCSGIWHQRQLVQLGRLCQRTDRDRAEAA